MPLMARSSIPLQHLLDHQPTQRHRQCEGSAAAVLLNEESTQMPAACRIDPGGLITCHAPAIRGDVYDERDTDHSRCVPGMAGAKPQRRRQLLQELVSPLPRKRQSRRTVALVTEAALIPLARADDSDD